MTARPSYDDLATLLSEGLDLCVRARQIDLAHKQQDARDFLPASAEKYPDAFPLCMTPHIWIQDQYDTDLTDWEWRACEVMAKVAFSRPHTTEEGASDARYQHLRHNGQYRLHALPPGMANTGDEERRG